MSAFLPGYLIRLKQKAGVFAQRHRARLTLFGTLALAILLIGGGIFFAMYRSYMKMVDQRLGSGSLRTSSVIYAAPRLVVPGESMTIPELVSRLQRAGYTEQLDNRTGHYRLLGDAVEITCGPESYFQPHTVVIRFANNKVSKLESVTDRKPTSYYWLEPELVTNVLDEGRGKRIPVHYSEFPPHMIHAIVSVEDKRFFQHSGLDLPPRSQGSLGRFEGTPEGAGRLDTDDAAGPKLLA
jgi:penicillin-binding protein 1B